MESIRSAITVWNMVGRRQRRKTYRFFVEKGVDDETQTFYGKKKFSAVMGSDDVRESIHSRLPANIKIPAKKRSKQHYQSLRLSRLFRNIRNPGKGNTANSTGARGMKKSARSAAIYCCRKMAGLPLNEIANQFGFGHYGSVSGSIARLDTYNIVGYHGVITIYHA